MHSKRYSGVNRKKAQTNGRVLFVRLHCSAKAEEPMVDMTPLPYLTPALTRVKSTPLLRNSIRPSSPIHHDRSRRGRGGFVNPSYPAAVCIRRFPFLCALDPVGHTDKGKPTHRNGTKRKGCVNVALHPKYLRSTERSSLHRSRARPNSGGSHRDPFQTSPWRYDSRLPSVYTISLTVNHSQVPGERWKEDEHMRQDTVHIHRTND